MLSDVIEHLDRFDDEDAIYVEEPLPSARAVVARGVEEGKVPPEASAVTVLPGRSRRAPATRRRSRASLGGRLTTKGNLRTTIPMGGS